MKLWANKWWLAVLTLVLCMAGDVATSIASFAANLSDDATFKSVSFKEWLLFGGSGIASLTITIRSLMSTSWTKVANTPVPPPRQHIERTPTVS